MEPFKINNNANTREDLASSKSTKSSNLEIPKELEQDISKVSSKSRSTRSVQTKQIDSNLDSDGDSEELEEKFSIKFKDLIKLDVKNTTS